ncbi:hypothetical protein [Heliophilum fasciatum]|uniref:Uncharacterized protein n=1 Tax=Heliophilum fasciatum TaxID=35700 RepID=A0A4V2SVU6_9FIRM|nr:hypothetical protein [Heliophilum fasciatum]MCW2279455.1 hypothetical protein [Heliophilum fasciatum]TCP59876.1 hypothetical protein EDD73_1476 [Heliophilum fasciatum]
MEDNEQLEKEKGTDTDIEIGTDTDADIFSADLYSDEDEEEMLRRLDDRSIVSGFERPADITPSLPPCEPRKKRRQASRRWLRISGFILALLIVAGGAVLFYTGKIPLGEATMGFAQTFSWINRENRVQNVEEASIVETVDQQPSSVEQALDVTTRSEGPPAEGPPAEAPPAWENGGLSTGFWTVVDSADGSNDDDNLAVHVVALKDEQFIVNIPEQGTLLGLDNRGEVIWRKTPERWGISNGKRIQRRWVGVLQGPQRKAIALSTGIEGMSYWSNIESPEQERPLPRNFTPSTLWLSITPEGGVIRSNRSGGGIEILDEAGKVMQTIPLYLPVAVTWCDDRQMLIASKNGLVYQVERSGEVLGQLGPVPKVRCLAYDLAGYVFIGSDDKVEVWHESGKKVTEWDVPDGCASLSVGTDGRLFVGDLKGKIQIFSPKKPGI